MGSARWDADAWSNYSSTVVSGKSRASVYSSRSLDPDLDPRTITLRESRDSALNPLSTPIIVAFDVTGSMGQIPHAFIGGDGAKGGLGLLVDEILRRSAGDTPMVTDPHIMMMGVGDAWCDAAPLQVTQFEADLRIADQMRRIWLEGGGGGNDCESYNLPWYFAARKTAVDSFEKRGRKGYLFTIGDEPPPPVLRKDHVAAVLGDTIPSDLASADVLTMAARMYQVFHVVIEQGSYYQQAPDTVRAGWNALLGQRVIYLPDYEKLAEVIISAIQVVEGCRVDDVVRSWSGDTSLVVARAIRDLTVPDKRAGGLVRF